MESKLIKYFFLCFLCSSVDSVLGQSENDSIINWSGNRKLQWADFKGLIPNNSGIDKAISYTSIYETYIPKGNIIEIKIFCCFEKKSSWSKDTSFSLLRHEQLHFDITELYARKMRRTSIILNKKLEKNLTVYEKAIDNLYNEKNLRQVNYDFETNHGTIKKKQEEWSCLIAKELEEMKDYEIDY